MPEIANVASADIYKTAQPQAGMSLADMLNISRSSLALQKEKELYGSSVEQAKAQSKLAQIQATGAEQKMPLEVQSAQTALNTQKLENLTKQANTTIQSIQKLSLKDDLSADDIVKEATELNKIQGGTPEALQSVLQSLPQNATPTQLKTWLARKQLQTLDSLSALERQYPQAQMTNLGNVVVPVQMGNQMLTGVQPGQQVGVASQLGLPPTTQVQGSAGEITYLGSPPNAPVVAAQGPMFQNQATLATKDWTETTAAQQEAANRIPVIQNIKKLAPEAFTGVGGARKELAAGILGAVGIDILTAEKTSTDELSKNAAILQLAGGNTDLARTIAEAANPNKKMTKEAIEGMANQLLGVEKLKQAKYDYLKPYTNDPIKYNEKSAQFAKFADYRLFQEMTAEEVAKLKQSMSPAQQKEISDKIKQAKMLGILR